MNNKILISSKTMALDNETLFDGSNTDQTNTDLVKIFGEMSKFFHTPSKYKFNEEMNPTSFGYIIHQINVTWHISMKQFNIDLPSIFQSDINYKHIGSPLHIYPHRLVQFNCLIVTGMKNDYTHCDPNNIPLYCSIDQILVQYHPAMTEVVAPCVCM